MESSIALREAPIDPHVLEIRRIFIEAQSWRPHHVDGRREQETGGDG